MTAVFDSVWSVIQHRADSAYLFLASLITLATAFGHVLTGGLSPALRTFTAASVFLSGNQWSWIKHTSEWITERSEVLHSAGTILMVAAAFVTAFQGSTSLSTKSGATLLLGSIIVVNTDGTTFWTWVPLVIAFLLGSLHHRDSQGRDWKGETSIAAIGLVVAVSYSVIAVIHWFIGRTRDSQANTTAP